MEDRPPRIREEDLRALRIDREQEGTARTRPRMWIWGGVGLIIALGLSGFAFLRWRAGREVEEVVVAEAVRRDDRGERAVLTAGGYVIARHQVEVGSKITGRVIALFVREGDFVREGQVIAQLEDSEIRAELQRAEATLAAARARLAELEAGSRPQEIERAQAEVARTEAELRNAELNWRRLQQLAERGVVERQALDDARARYEMARAAHRAAQESYELVRIGPRPEHVALARAEVQQAEAAVRLARAQLEHTLIRAPISGTVLDRYVDVGEMVTIGFTSDRGAKQALVSLADLRDLQVELDVSEADIARVELGQSAQIVPDAYPQRRYRGVVEYIAPIADRQKATIRVKVKVLDPDEYLRPDMSAKVTFYEKGTDGRTTRPVVLVPQSALFIRDGRTLIFVVRDGRAVLQSVTAGREEGGYREILNGLQGGERVIARGWEKLNEGDRVNVRP
ncbi:MAG: efflux RND transporter periplasmic adaptor subunit [Blastocatellia bacterium]|nr:efflux RND transporter periplasmic adaptor subunit [Blastocatellia bacterium]